MSKDWDGRLQAQDRKPFRGLRDKRGTRPQPLAWPDKAIIVIGVLMGLETLRFLLTLAWRAVAPLAR